MLLSVQVDLWIAKKIEINHCFVLNELKNKFQQLNINATANFFLKVGGLLSRNDAAHWVIVIIYLRALELLKVTLYMTRIEKIFILLNYSIFFI